RVSCGFLQAFNNWIFFPTKLEVFISLDGADYTLAGSFTPSDSLIDKKLCRYDFPVEVANFKGRYIRVMAVATKTCPLNHPSKGEKSWLFSDEIVVE
ncbi:MAG: hypothetical protein WCL00_12705, partial [Bacteroidota bacterium]